MLHNYCEKNRHNFITLDYEILSSHEISHSFKHGSAYSINFQSKCTTCGETISTCTRMSPHQLNQYYYEQIIPKDCLDNIEYTVNGMSYKEIIKEIIKYEVIKEYILELKNDMCKMFGHDAKLIDREREIFECNCCGKTMGYQQYIDAYFSAQYHRVVDYYYADHLELFKVKENKDYPVSLCSMDLDEKIQERLNSELEEISKEKTLKKASFFDLTDVRRWNKGYTKLPF